MMQSLLSCGIRLAEALRAENEALAAMDLAQAATMTDAKMAATDAFAAAWNSARHAGPQAASTPAQAAAAALADRLAHLSAENRRLLEHAIALQARVIETIAGAAMPRGAPPTYGQSGARATMRATSPVALSSRV
ncbi:hypothetical protein ACQW02_05010 [Humitalea sp. 24SJ18S-53]|uniref:hypothetical protein n=1 Tax=Humitalea sp. 24SJ18S-53 TaxID=3422307 RepID=UPI003D6704D6